MAKSQKKNQKKEPVVNEKPSFDNYMKWYNQLAKSVMND
jgi:hypothetical protein